MSKEEIEYRERLKLLEKHIGEDYYMIGSIHGKISDAMEEYHQSKLKNYGDLGDVSVLFPYKEEIQNASVNCNPEDVNINAYYHFEAGVLWLKSYIKKQITQ